MTIMKRLVGICLAAILPLISSADSIEDHNFPNSENHYVAGAIKQLTDDLYDGRFDELQADSQTLQAWLKDSDLNRRETAQVLNNLAILIARSGELNDALLLSNESEQLLESISPFEPDLFHVLMAKSYVLIYESAFDEAEDALRHAQNVAHRNQGVYAREQIPTLRLLTEVQTNTGQRRDADQTQRFFLRVNEQTHGPNSEEIIPALAEVGQYFANRGRIIPSGQARSTNVFMVGRNRSIELDSSEADFAYRTRIFREAEMAYERSISIIKDKYGETDLRLVEPLIGLSKTKFYEGYARTHAKKPMERMAEIVMQNPGADLGDRAKALVDLGDLYIKTEDSRAEETYLKAWSLLKGDQHEELRYELFGRPVRLLPEHNFTPTLTRYPVSAEPGEQLFVALNFNVMSNGRVRQVEVMDSNIPLREQKLTRSAIQLMKYRPRIVNGEMSDTIGLSLHQTFTVSRPQPEFSAEITTDVNAP